MLTIHAILKREETVGGLARVTWYLGTQEMGSIHGSIEAVHCTSYSSSKPLDRQAKDKPLITNSTAFITRPVIDCRSIPTHNHIPIHTHTRLYPIGQRIR